MTKRWRLRAIVETGPVLRPELYVVRDNELSVQPLANAPPNLRLVSLYREEEDSADPRDVFVRAHDGLQEFLDRVAVVGYGPAGVVEWLSLVPESVSVGEVFPTVMINAVVQVASVELIPDDLVGFDVHEPDSTAARISRLFRLAISTGSVEERYLGLYSVLEQVGEAETNEHISSKCPKCGTSVKGPKATGNAVRSLIGEAGGDIKKAPEWRKLRGKVAHGGGLRNMDFIDALGAGIVGIESASLAIVAERNAINVRKNQSAFVGLPIVVYTCRAEGNGAFKPLDATMGAHLGRTEVKRRASAKPQPEDVVNIAIPTEQDVVGLPDLVWPEVKPATPTSTA